MKMKTIILSILAITILIGALALNAIFIAPKKINVRFETLSDTEIPASLDEISILFFSDTLYNEFVDYQQLEKIITTIDELHPDIILFGGDLFSKPDRNIVSPEEIIEITALLHSIEAPLGKFAVLGDQDNTNSITNDLISNILTNSDFEILNNYSVRITNDSNDFINIIGLTNSVNGSPNITNAFNGLDDKYSIVLTHAPDIVDSLPHDKYDYMLAGHSLGGQIYIPLLGPVFPKEGAINYHTDKYHINNTILDITNGLGTTEHNIRLFAEAEVVLYTLKSVNENKD